MIKVTHKGNFNKTKSLLKNIRERKYLQALDKIGNIGTDALSKATPKDTGKTAASWSYYIEERNGSVAVVWTNSNIVNEWANVAILIQYGHATKNGGYVQGRDYINPAMQPLFDALAKDAWEAVVQ